MTVHNRQDERAQPLGESVRQREERQHREAEAAKPTPKSITDFESLKHALPDDKAAKVAISSLTQAQINEIQAKDWRAICGHEAGDENNA